MSAPRDLAEFVDRGPLSVMAGLLLVTLLVTVPLGLVARAIRDGVLYGWRWGDRS